VGLSTRLRLLRQFSTQFTCLTGTKVQILTHAALEEQVDEHTLEALVQLTVDANARVSATLGTQFTCLRYWYKSAQVTCFTGTSTTHA
jgi:hypothetical protein